MQLPQERRQDAISMKKSANELYVSSQHKEAIAIYTEALDLCPLCFEEDRAILLANRAAAKIKLVSGSNKYRRIYGFVGRNIQHPFSIHQHFYILYWHLNAG